MNSSDIKLKLFLIKVVDWFFVLVVLGIGLPAMFYSEHRPIYAVGVILGLALINRIGTWSLNRIAQLQYSLDRMQKNKVLHGR